MAMSQKQLRLKKKIQMQNMIILALAIVIIVLIGVSSTAAWYIRTRSDSADLILSNPVNIYITEFVRKENADGTDYNEHTTVEDILDGYNNKIYPGDSIELNFGVQLGTPDLESSSAYVRVKFSLAITKISGDGVAPEGDLEILQGNYLNINDKAINTRDWYAVDFNNPEGKTKAELGPDHVEDIWYVLRDTAGGKTVARAMKSMEQVEFLDGDITLSRTEITNKMANHKFHIVYTVQAIQTANISDPITSQGRGSDKAQERELCPWWTKEEIKYE